MIPTHNGPRVTLVLQKERRGKHLPRLVDGKVRATVVNLQPGIQPTRHLSRVCTKVACNCTVQAVCTPLAAACLANERFKLVPCGATTQLLLIGSYKINNSCIYSKISQEDCTFCKKITNHNHMQSPMSPVAPIQWSVPHNFASK